MAINDQINSLDPNALANLRMKAKDNSPEAVRAAAKQFEALFMQQVMKSMRDASPKDGMFNSDESRMYQSLLDQQLATQLTVKGKGTGLAAMIEKQLLGAGKTVTPPAGPVPLSPPSAAVPLGAAPAGSTGAIGAVGKNGTSDATGTVGTTGTTGTTRTTGTTAAAASAVAAKLAAPATQSASGRARHGHGAERSAATGQGRAAGQSSSVASAGASSAKQAAASTPRAFIDRVWPHAVAASKETGIPAHFLVAQAALETGWGRSEIRTASGEPTHNLFNIKAGRNWTGATASVHTAEYVGGASRREAAQFRAYASEAEAFADYARMIRNNPRYAAVAGKSDAAGFAQGLQAAGYATDPSYADKLQRIIGGGTLRTALASAAGGGSRSV